MENMRNWGYIIDMPDGPGGSKPSLEGYTMKCERCSQPYRVKSTALAEECLYHYGRQFSQKVNGERPERQLSRHLILIICRRENTVIYVLFKANIRRGRMCQRPARLL
jgi:hypothetical protein